MNNSSNYSSLCNYFYRDVELVCSEGDILNCTLDGICVSCDSNYSLNAGIGAIVRLAGGIEFQRRLNAVSRNGNVIAIPTTGCGRIRAPFVILAPLRRSHRGCMHFVYEAIFKCARALNLCSLAVPALGTGAYGLSFQDAAQFMKMALESLHSFHPLQKIQFIDLNVTSLHVFRNVFNDLACHANSFNNLADTSIISNSISSANSPSLDPLVTLASDQSPFTPNSVTTTTPPQSMISNANDSTIVHSLSSANSPPLAQPVLASTQTSILANSDCSAIPQLDVSTDTSTHNTTDDDVIFISNMPSTSHKTIPLNDIWTYVSTNELSSLRAKNVESQKELASSGREWMHLEEDVLPCSICLCELLSADAPSPQNNNINNNGRTSFGNENEKVIRLNICRHIFHEKCIEKAFEVKRQCPLCMSWCAPAEGTQPLGAQMRSRVIRGRVPGYQDANGFHEIRYTIPSGVQTARHPRPGVPFYGTTRTAYLPNNEEGTLTLRLFELAFKRRLIFTVGDSATSGRRNVVVWNCIHHKTNKTGGSQNFGYPDSGYLARVQEELASVGIHKNLLTG